MILYSVGRVAECHPEVSATMYSIRLHMMFVSETVQPRLRQCKHCKQINTLL